MQCRVFIVILSVIMLNVLSPSSIQHPFSGKPILAALTDEYMLFLTTVVYFVVFFGPADVGHSLLHYTPVYATICVLKEVLRAKKVLGGTILVFVFV